MRRAIVSIVIAVVSWAACAAGECLPSGRGTFVAGLDALNRGDLQAAATSFDELVKAQPDCAEARNNLAVVLVEQGHLNAAADQLRRAVQLRPDYQRARLNLDRVEGLLAAQQAPTPHATTALAVEAPAPVPAEAAVAPTVAPKAASAPGSVAVLEPVGTTACVFVPRRQQLCVYRRTPESITNEACYGIAARVATWPQWLVASDLTGQRIRLVDETGQRRLKLVPEGAATGTDVVVLRARDFEALAAQVVPWRTGWVAQDGIAAGSEAAAIAVRTAVERWRQAWERQRFDEYISFYGAGFRPQSEHDVATWRARKQYLFEHSGPITVQIEAPSIFLLDDGATAVVNVEQVYHSEIFASRSVKVLRWQRQGDHWTISAEMVLREGPGAAGGSPGAGQ